MRGYNRYFAFMSLFTASMLGLVLASNILQLFVFWELVGLCSYLLIGFWFYKDSARRAAKKAFLVTRLGDLGFLIAILLIWSETGTLDIGEIQELAIAGAIGSTALTWFALGLFAGAAGKSAQFPLHVWLPDAMEGPTPVSALIHAATMVAAGVYLVARFFPVFAESEEALTTVAAIGAITAIIAALLGIVATDIKRVLAYSTISQLGYMMMALGVGGHRGGDLPPLHARVLQGAAVPRLRLGQPRDGHLRHAQDGRAVAVHADHLLRRSSSAAWPGRALSARRLLEQGRDPGRRLGGPAVGVRRRR